MNITVNIEELIRDEVSRQLAEREKVSETLQKEPQTCIGQQALAKHLGVSTVTVNRWHREGRFNGCYTRIGKKICYDLSKIERKFQA